MSFIEIALDSLSFFDRKSTLKPIFKLVVDGVEFSNEINNRIESISLTETRGMKADDVNITLSDHDGAVVIPDDGKIIEVWLGFEDQSAIGTYLKSGLVFKGTFKIDDVTHSGAPDKISLKGVSMDLTEKWAEQQEKSWKNKTIGEIIKEIAETHDCDYKISDEFINEKIEHINQNNESDASFLTRLADEYGAGVNFKNGILLFISLDNPITAGGEMIPPFLINRIKGDKHSYSRSKGEDVKAVKAYYKDKKTNKKLEIIINASNLEANPKPKPQKPKGKKGQKGKPKGAISVKDPSAKLEAGEKVKTLRHLYASRASAMTGARSAFKKLKRKVSKFTLSLAVGMPSLFPQTPVYVQGFKDAIDSEAWIIKQISHSLSASGLTSNIELESRLFLESPEEPEGNK